MSCDVPRRLIAHSLSTLSRVVAESTNATAQAVDGTDQDHLAVLLTHKYRSYRPRVVKSSLERNIDDLVPVGLPHIRKRNHPGNSGVAHQNVDRSQFAAGLLNDGLRGKSAAAAARIATVRWPMLSTAWTPSAAATSSLRWVKATSAPRFANSGQFLHPDLSMPP